MSLPKLPSLSTVIRDTRFALGIARRRPFQVLLQVSNRCNMKCSFCDFWPNVAPRKDELTVADYQRIADELAELGCFLVSVEGGEPTLRADLDQIIAAFARKHVPVLFTNGWNITKERAEQLFAAGVTQVGVSIDFANAARHDHKRGLQGASERAWRAIDLLKAAAPHGGKQVHVMSVLMRENQEEIEALFARSAAHEVGHQFTLLSQSGFRRSQRTADDQLPDVGMGEKLLSLWQRFPHVRYLRDYAAQIDPFLSGAQLPQCSAGRQSFNIDHIGDVALCIEKINRPLGNVKRESMATIYARLASDTQSASCQDCFTACRGFAQALSSGGTPRAWRDLATRMRSY